MPRPVHILGGGVSGLTVGVVLHALGVRTRVVAARHLGDAGPDAPAFASLYPAASVLPHAVQVPGVARHLRRSQAVFGLLAEAAPAAGVRRQWHAEVFEAPRPDPPYAPALDAFARLPESGSGAPGIPRRADAEGVFGWTCRILFAEMPTYGPWLAYLYRATGGTITTRRLVPADVSALRANVLVNALGAGAPALFPDDRPAEALLGCLVYATPPGPARHPRTGGPFSYNYTPAPGVYPTAEGDAPGSVYVYPRADAWVLGGSKRHVRTKANGTRHVAPIPGPTTRVPGPDGAPLTIPAPVIDLNRQLLRGLTGHDVARQPMRGVEGLRYARDLGGEGVRLEAEERGGRLVLHDVGHGGAGVTLSWSAACAVASLLREHAGLPADEDLPVPPEALMPASAWRRLQRLARRTTAGD